LEVVAMERIVSAQVVHRLWKSTVAHVLDPYLFHLALGQDSPSPLGRMPPGEKSVLLPHPRTIEDEGSEWNFRSAHRRPPVEREDGASTLDRPSS
jgi:hypothetical protein